MLQFGERLFDALDAGRHGVDKGPPRLGQDGQDGSIALLATLRDVRDDLWLVLHVVLQHARQGDPAIRLIRARDTHLRDQVVLPAQVDRQLVRH
ncbi:unnamed protein product [Sphagnum jensenii]|uniref:Uncharacterized protein n=1 Tax=Sphagnum jensenii TaxID=128206 RepID=A0ABP1AH82_9BRYO